jgi:hypothetical protein
VWQEIRKSENAMIRNICFIAAALLLLTVCGYAMGGFFSTNVHAEHATPPIANELLCQVLLVMDKV